MKLKFVFFSLFYLVSFSQINCQKDYKVIHAFYYNWFGGVKGVRGKVFEIKIAKLSKNQFVLKNLIVNEVKFQISQNEENGYLIVNARVNDGDYPDVTLNQEINKNNFYIEYADKKGKIKKIKIPFFEYKKTSTINQEKPS